MNTDLGRYPRVTLAHLPTPLEELAALGRDLGTRVLVKRDDCTGLAFGGNKTRKLEFTLGRALAEHADVIVTSGGLQSNHVRQTAAAAAKLGLDCHAVLSRPPANTAPEFERSGNRLLDDLLGARAHVVEEPEVDAHVEQLAASLRRDGRSPFVVPLGASDGTGALGYVECARELLEQCSTAGFAPSHVFVATGSAGTQAGLLTGLRVCGSATAVVGVSVSESSELKRAKVRSVCDQTARVLELESTPVADADIAVLDDYVGSGYGVPTRAGTDAIRRLARAEGLLLDPVYTAKAMAGMLDVLARRAAGEVRDPVFLHTGGAPALFAYPHPDAE